MTPQQLKKELLKFDKVALSDIIISAISRKREFKNAILEQVNERVKIHGSSAFSDEDLAERKLKINDGLLNGYWKDLKKIVNSFNNYGGGSTKDENKAYDLFEKLNTLAQKEAFSAVLRMKIFEEILAEHKRGNSGFDDVLDELANNLCVYKSDWEALADYYDNQKYFSSYYSDKAAKIRKDKLGEERTF